MVEFLSCTFELETRTYYPEVQIYLAMEVKKGLKKDGVTVPLYRPMPVGICM